MMMSKLSGLISAWCVLTLAVSSVPAFAQGSQGQPMQGGAGQGGAGQVPAGTAGGQQRAWFGNGTGRIGQNLSGRLSLGGGVIDRRRTDPVTFDETIRRSDNWHASGGLTYALTGASASLAISAGSSVNSFAGLSDQLVVSHRGQVSAGLPLSSRTSLSASVGAFREPTVVRYLRGLFGSGPGFAPPDDFDAGDVRDATVSYQASASLRQELTTRSALAFGYNHRRSNYAGADEQQIHDNASARYTLSITEGFGVRFGYGYMTSRQDVPGAVRSENHHVDAGVNYNKALSLSRNTTLSFGTGSAIARSQNHTRFFVTGDAGLTHRIGRSWSVAGHYSRNVRFIEGVTEVAFVDSMSANVGGNPAARVTLNASVSTHRGGVGLGAGQNPLRGLAGHAAVSIAAAQNVGLSLHYGYYRSRFGSTAFLLSPELQLFERHTVGVSVGLWGLVSLGVNYSDATHPFNHNRAVLASVGFFAPLYARARQF